MRPMVHRVRVVDTTMKILAVKLVREMTGLGLKDSLDRVETKAFFDVSLDDATLLSFVEDGRRGGVQFEFVPPLDASAVTSGWSSMGDPTGEFAIRYRSGPNKIGAIKLARELAPELGLSHAKDIVEQQGLVIAGIVAREAERIVGLFDAIGSVVEVERSSGVGSTPSVSAPSVPPPRAGAANHVYGYSSDDDDF
jgi:ribosomal protein L7/L12